MTITFIFSLTIILSYAGGDVGGKEPQEQEEKGALLMWSGTFLVGLAFENFELKHFLGGMGDLRIRSIIWHMPTVTCKGELNFTHSTKSVDDFTMAHIFTAFQEKIDIRQLGHWDPNLVNYTHHSKYLLGNKSSCVIILLMNHPTIQCPYIVGSL